MSRHTIKGRVELFPQKGGWYYVRVPKKYSGMYADRAERGLIAVHATLGGSTWKTSLLPMGDGTHFIALNAKVRKAEKKGLGDRVTITFEL